MRCSNSADTLLVAGMNYIYPKSVRDKPNYNIILATLQSTHVSVCLCVSAAELFIY